MRMSIGVGSAGALAVVAMFLLAGVPLAGGNEYQYSVTFPLLAGKKDIGAEVKVWHDNENFYVKFTTTGDWYLSETHVAISVQESCPSGDPSGIPAKNGN
ncbi:MAG: hypothetical protein QW379_02345, partial [Thermoplasmata archaeon]